MFNHAMGDLSPGQLMHAKEIAKPWPLVKKRRDASTCFNCHGLTFGGRRTWISGSTEVARCLSDDRWHEVLPADSIPGDIVVYFDDAGDASHSGIIVDFNHMMNLPVVCSKWGWAGEFIHLVSEVPKAYGHERKYYRCGL